MGSRNRQIWKLQKGWTHSSSPDSTPPIILWWCPKLRTIDVKGVGHHSMVCFSEQTGVSSIRHPWPELPVNFLPHCTSSLVSHNVCGMWILFTQTFGFLLCTENTLIYQLSTSTLTQSIINYLHCFMDKIDCITVFSQITSGKQVSHCLPKV